MNIFRCPLCGSVLDGEKTLKCENNHCFDRAKSGYVNLLSGKGKNHGDPKEMVLSRRNFLDKDYYLPLAQKISTLCFDYTPENSVILDAGCGECYYTHNIYKEFLQKGKNALFCGIDVSKDAVNYGAKRFPQCCLATASVYAMPIADNSVDTVINIFSPLATKEYLRVLKNNGIFIMAIGGQDHLWSLKKAVYDTPYKNEPSDYTLNGFELIKKEVLRYETELCSNEDIMSLFSMTPYYHKTAQKDIEKLKKLDTLSTEIEFEILCYKVNSPF
ncbi:MAG: methyltransferase domain-containing protein [Clostridia bacterium]|nr:methyltransferase domain-containing protein [Clostridia bacterium]